MSYLALNLIRKRNRLVKALDWQPDLGNQVQGWLEAHEWMAGWSALCRLELEEALRFSYEVKTEDPYCIGWQRALIEMESYLKQPRREVWILQKPSCPLKEAAALLTKVSPLMSEAEMLQLAKTVEGKARPYLDLEQFRQGSGGPMTPSLERYFVLSVLPTGTEAR